MLRVVSPSISDILESHGRIQAKPFGNCLQTLGTERPFRVNVNGLSLGTTFRDSHLARDAKSVAELRLARAEFTKDLGNGPSFNPSFQQLTET